MLASVRIQTYSFSIWLMKFYCREMEVVKDTDSSHGWGAKDDAMLVLGMYRHGPGSWQLIAQVCLCIELLRPPWQWIRMRTIFLHLQ